MAFPTGTVPLGLYGMMAGVLGLLVFVTVQYATDPRAAPPGWGVERASLPVLALARASSLLFIVGAIVAGAGFLYGTARMAPRMAAMILEGLTSPRASLGFAVTASMVVAGTSLVALLAALFPAYLMRRPPRLVGWAILISAAIAVAGTVTFMATMSLSHLLR